MGKLLNHKPSPDFLLLLLLLENFVGLPDPKGAGVQVDDMYMGNSLLISHALLTKVGTYSCRLPKLLFETELD
jgi:hypothetical protein